MNIAAYVEKECCQKGACVLITAREHVIRNDFSPVIELLSQPASPALVSFMPNIISNFFIYQLWKVHLGLTEKQAFSDTLLILASLSFLHS